MLIELCTNVPTMASQPARSRRSRAKSSKLTDALKTASASLEPENRSQTPKKRLREDANIQLSESATKRLKIEQRPVFEAPPRKAQGEAAAQALKIIEPQTPANKPPKTYQTRRSGSASANPTPAKWEEKVKTVSQSKVANGIRHELERLGVPVTPAGTTPEGGKGTEEKRKLRSEGRARFKSELALYFPEYDVVMKNEEGESSKFDLTTDRNSLANHHNFRYTGCGYTDIDNR